MGKNVHLFDLRYVFDYYDGKPTIKGKWNEPFLDKEQAAWKIDKNGLANAMVEAKNRKTKERKYVVVCPGQDFRFFQWMVMTPVGSIAGTQKCLNIINLGIVMWTRTKKISVYNVGKIETKDLTENELIQHFAAYGR